jgi:anti-sigma regulatory factor (Ser/Thr protein kinase)
MTIDVRDVESGDHVVQFYERDTDLIVAVGHYLAVAVKAGGVALAIATESHRRSLEDQLVAEGVDLDLARHHGQIVLLDAATMMSTFVADGRVDGDAFHSVIGRLVGEAAKKGRPVRAYGEMVALLWDAGNVLSAIQLESLWNDLGESLPFSLYCAYHAESVSGSEHAEAFQRLCHLHSDVLRGPSHDVRSGPSVVGTEVAAQFAAKTTAARAVRHFVVDALRQWGWSRDLIDDVELVSSELAANAVVHACPPFTVTLRTNGSLVRLEIRDSRPAVRNGESAGLIARPGRGLGVVAALSLRWGVEASGATKVVWAELAGPESDAVPRHDDRVEGA